MLITIRGRKLGNSSSSGIGRDRPGGPDRRRADVDRYFAVAEGLGLRLTHALDTHLHNDFVSGAREAAARGNLAVGASADARLAFDHLPLSDGTSICLGDLVVETIATPGHTPEHVSYAVRQAGGEEVSAIFTGGALIVGGVARTDLLGPDMTDSLTRQLYHTIHDRLLALPDDVTVYPTHGAGSFCVAPASSARTTTLGQERLHNELVQARSEAEFAARALADLPSYPTYFRYMREINRQGHGCPAVCRSLLHFQPARSTPLSRRNCRDRYAQSADFMAGHIPAATESRLAPR
jgi:hydroxyacylglutathione hydrolase